MTEQVPRELAALIAAERAAPTASAAVRISVRAKVAAAVAGAPLGVAATGLGIGKVIAIVAVTVGAGTATVVGVEAHRGRREVARSEVATTVKSEPPRAAPAVPGGPPAPVIALPEPTAGARVRPVIHVAAPPQAERIKEAWAALTAGDPARALEVVEQDAREHPIGVLGEEREAVRIVALARLGKLDAARRAAAAFRDRYPTSIHLELIARSLGEEPR